MIISMPSDDCYFVNWDTRVFSGYTKKGAAKISQGDELRCDMAESKRVARFRVKTVQYLPVSEADEGVRSQYVGTCTDVGYLEDY